MSDKRADERNIDEILASIDEMLSQKIPDIQIPDNRKVPIYQSALESQTTLGLSSSHEANGEEHHTPETTAPKSFAPISHMDTNDDITEPSEDFDDETEQNAETETDDESEFYADDDFDSEFEDEDPIVEDHSVVTHRHRILLTEALLEPSAQEALPLWVEQDDSTDDNGDEVSEEHLNTETNSAQSFSNEEPSVEHDASSTPAEQNDELNSLQESAEDSDESHAVHDLSSNEDEASLEGFETTEVDFDEDAQVDDAEQEEELEESSVTNENINDNDLDSIEDHGEENKVEAYTFLSTEEPNKVEEIEDAFDSETVQQHSETDDFDDSSNQIANDEYTSMDAAEDLGENTELVEVMMEEIFQGDREKDPILSNQQDIELLVEAVSQDISNQLQETFQTALRNLVKTSILKHLEAAQPKDSNTKETDNN